MTGSTSSPEKPIRLYHFPLSGHSHRALLFLNLLDLPYEIVPVNLRKGEQRLPDFLALNAFGQVPVIDDNGLVVPDSNAILVYLAKRYDQSGAWLPEDPERAARVQRWLSVAAGPLAAGPATARVINVFGRQINPDEIITRSNALLKIMNAELTDRDFFAGDAPTIADVALYTYTAHAPEGNVSLEPYPQVQAWLRRVESLPRFVPMERTPVGLYAENAQ